MWERSCPILLGSKVWGRLKRVCQISPPFLNPLPVVSLKDIINSFPQFFP